MTREEFKALCDKGVVLLDGAMGTNLIKAGMKRGESTELFALEHKDAVKDLQRAYVDAGSVIVYAPTFSANRAMIESKKLGYSTEYLNKELVKLCREAVGEDAYVAGDMTMTGEQLEPIGDLTYEEAVEIYIEQASALYEAGVDLFVVETMVNLDETRACVEAIEKVCDLPIMVSFTVDEAGKTFMGTDIKDAAKVMEDMGVDAFGTNCSVGPDKMLKVVGMLKETTDMPIIAKANAGSPEYVNGETVYLISEEDYSSQVIDLVKAGAALVGGCCGTTPAMIKAIADKLK